MGLVNNCSDIFAACSGTTANQYSTTGATVDFNNCPAYQVQSGDSWAALTGDFYGTEDQTAYTNFAMAQMVLDAGPISPGWWLWLPSYVVDSAGAKHDLRCVDVEEPCGGLAASDLHGVYYNPSMTGAPANGACGY